MGGKGSGQPSKRAPAINRVLLEAGNEIRKLYDDTGLDLDAMVFYQARRYVQKVLWSLSPEELNNVAMVSDAIGLWTKAMDGARRFKQKEVAR